MQGKRRHYEFLAAALLWLFSWGLPDAAVAARAPDLDVKVEKIGDEIHANVTLFVRASPQYAWEVVTDFERAPEFTPNLELSKIVRRSGDTVRLHQITKVRFGPFSVPVETVRDVRLFAPVRTEARLVSGSLKSYVSVTEVIPEGNGTRILFRSQAVPSSALAPFAGESLSKRETEESFRQLRAEILRREHVAARQ